MQRLVKKFSRRGAPDEQCASLGSYMVRCRMDICSVSPRSARSYGGKGYLKMKNRWTKVIGQDGRAPRGLRKIGEAQVAGGARVAARVEQIYVKSGSKARPKAPRLGGFEIAALNIAAGEGTKGQRHEGTRGWGASSTAPLSLCPFVPPFRLSYSAAPPDDCHRVRRRSGPAFHLH